MKLRRLDEAVYCLTGPVNIGILAGSGGKGVVVDTGLDEGAARKTLRALRELGLQPAVIINTHAHADHFGGNRYICETTGAQVWAPAFEADVIRNPLWEPLYLYGGASPPPTLRDKFLLAEPSPVHVELAGSGDEEGRAPEAGVAEVIEGVTVEFVPLPGHSLRQVGVAAGVGQRTLFAGDAFLGAEVLMKHGIPYVVDVGACMRSLQRLREHWQDYSWVVPGHGAIHDCVAEDVESNLTRLEEMLQAISTILRGTGAEPVPEGDLTVRLLERFQLRPATPNHYLLYMTAVRACLTFLAAGGLAEPVVEGGDFCWKAIG